MKDYEIEPKDHSRFWQKVAKTANCWHWVGCATSSGYGQFKVRGRAAYAHRVSYALAVGLIPDGLVIDHLCRNRRCVNPSHLEAVTAGTNTLRGMGPTAERARKTHCQRGHLLAGDNLRPSAKAKGYRICRTCDLIAARARRSRSAGAMRPTSKGVF